MKLDDLTAMMHADELHRYELSPEGVVTISPSPGVAHAVVASRLMAWLAEAGVPAERFAQAVGLHIPGPDGATGGRIPDLTVWSKAQVEDVWLPATDVILTVEIVSPGSEGMDTVTKRKEYADAGIPQYWMVDQNPDLTVIMHFIAGYQYTMPLAWLLNTSPAEHGLA